MTSPLEDPFSFQREVEPDLTNRDQMFAPAPEFLGDVNSGPGIEVTGMGATAVGQPRMTPSSQPPLQRPDPMVQDPSLGGGGLDLGEDLSGSSDDPVPLASGAEMLFAHPDNAYSGNNNAWLGEPAPDDEMPALVGGVLLDPPAGLNPASPHLPNMMPAATGVVPVHTPYPPVLPVSPPAMQLQPHVRPPAPPAGPYPTVTVPPPGLSPFGPPSEDDLPVLVQGQLLPPMGFAPAPAQPGSVPPPNLWQPQYPGVTLAPPPPPAPPAQPDASTGKTPLQSEIDRLFDEE
jgi:hypothetical protein